jgi:pimeloyl-ACP methyl ester carboxylesterase
MAFNDRLGALAAWAVTMPARRFFFKRKDLREIEFPSEDSLKLRGWLADVPNARGTVVVGHGYRDDRRQMLSLAPALGALGLRAVLIDFRAHGRSEGSRITIGVEEARDVRASLAWARELGGPVSYVGFSMGAAAYLMSGIEAHCAVIDSPYGTLSEAIAVRGAFVRAPAGLLESFRRAKEQRCDLVVEEVRPVDRVAHLQRPTQLVFARGDAWIGADVRARYHRAMSLACEYVEVEGGHDSHFDAAWIVHVARFLEKHAHA